MAHRSVLAVALIALGCGGARSSAVGPDASAEHRDEAADARATPNDEAAGSLRQETLADRGWAMVQSRAVGLRVPLPDARAWSELDEERWFALTHEPSSSSLRFRTWRAPLRVSKDDCREQVYLWRSELRPRGEPMIEKSLGAPSGYDVGMRIDVERAESGAFTAVLLAYGAGVRRCYAAVFQTMVEHAGAESELGGRLRLITEGVLNRVELIDIEEIPGQPPFATP